MIEFNEICVGSYLLNRCIVIAYICLVFAIMIYPVEEKLIDRILNIMEITL